MINGFPRMVKAALCLLMGSLATQASRGTDLSASSPKDVATALYAAIEAEDSKRLDALLSDDVTWIYHGPQYLIPFAGMHRGRAGVADFFAKVAGSLTDVTAGQHEILVSGDRVAVLGWEEGTVVATGGHYRVRNVHLFRVSDGKIMEFEEFVDAGDVLEAFMPGDIERGRAFYVTCAGCHGTDAQGKAEMHAPNLTGLGRNYIVRQLRNFRAERRGNADDFYGFQMIGRARAIPGDRAVRDVAAYIESLPVSVRAAASAGSDKPKAGKFKAGGAPAGGALYESCAACHGAKAEGNDELFSPPLKQLDSWYLRTQLKNFKAGIRGKAAGDMLGAQMIAAVSALPDDAAIDSVVDYIQLLR